MWSEIEKVAKDVYAGKYGNGSKRVALLTNAGYDPSLVQQMVNYLYYGGDKPIIEEEDEVVEPVVDSEVLTVDVNLNVHKKLVIRFV